MGRRIYRIQPLEGLASQAASAGVIFGGSLVGAPTSTTQVVASSVVGIGVGRRRWHHVHWAIVRQMALAWLITHADHRRRSRAVLRALAAVSR